MAEYKITYHLPVSVVRLVSTKTITTDNVVAATPKVVESWQTSAELDVAADRSSDTTLQAEVKAGALLNTNVELGLSGDGRLTSASSESTGAAIPLVKGLVTVGVAGAALALGGGIPAAALAAAVTKKVTDGARFTQALEQLDVAKEDLERAKEEDPAESRYKKEHPHEHALRALAARQVSEAEMSLGEALEAAIDDPSTANLNTVWRYRRLRDMAREELEKAGRHFRVWRQALTQKRTETHEHIVTMDQLCTARVAYQDGVLAWVGRVPEWAKQLWSDVGTIPVLEPAPCPEGRESVQSDEKAVSGIHVRRSRLVHISIYSRVPGDELWKATLVSSNPYDVVDSRSPIDLVEFRKSVFSKRAVAVELSETGTLSKYVHTTTSAAAEVGTALSELPSSVAGALEEAKAIRETFGALRDLKEDEELDRLKREVEKKQKEIEMAGLVATEADYAELKRLEQRAQILETGRSIAVAEATSNELAGEIASIKQQLELATTSRDLQTEQLLSELRVLADAVATLERVLNPSGSGDGE